MRLVVSLTFKIDTKPTQTPKKRHKMAKIDTHKIKILHVEVVDDGILIKAIGLFSPEGDYIRDTKLNGKLLCTLTESLMDIKICE
jgi:hypothetical protein